MIANKNNMIHHTVNYALNMSKNKIYCDRKIDKYVHIYFVFYILKIHEYKRTPQTNKINIAKEYI